MPAAVTDDPTLDFLGRLGDASRWVVRRNVPVFVPHEREGADGSSIRVDPSRLALVADQMARLQADQGIVAPIGPGHRRREPAFPEREQPPVWGFAVNPRVGTFGPHGSPCVLVDEYFRPEHADEAGEFPFRSVEFYPQRNQFRWVALLRRDPFLDMGMVAYSDGLLFYATEPTAMADDVKDRGPAEDAEGAEGVGAAAPPAVGDEPGDMLSPEEEHKAEQYMRHYQRSHPWVGYAMKCYDASAAAAAPSPTNTAPPGPAAPAAAPAPKDDDMKSLQSKETPVAYQRLESRLAALEAENKALRVDRDRNACLAQLREQCEQYEYDPAREAAAMLPLDAAGRKAHVEYIRKSHARRPAAGEGFIETYQGGAELPGVAAGFGPEEMTAALDYMSAHRCSYEAAVEAVEAGKHKAKVSTR